MNKTARDELRAQHAPKQLDVHPLDLSPQESGLVCTVCAYNQVFTADDGVRSVAVGLSAPYPCDVLHALDDADTKAEALTQIRRMLGVNPRSDREDAALALAITALDK